MGETGQKIKGRLNDNFFRESEKNFKIGKIVTFEFGFMESIYYQNSRTFDLKNKIGNSRKFLSLLMNFRFGTVRVHL
jgi:hypothetical protein